MKSTSTLKPLLRPLRRIAAMELCTSRAISTLSHSHHRKLSYSNPSPLRSTTRTFLPLKKKITASQKNPGFRYLGTSILRSTTSEETLTSKNEPFGARDGTITSDETPDDAQNTYEEVTKVEVPKEESLMGEQMQLLEVFDGLNLKLDSEETQSTLIYGSTALIGLWLASAVVGAVDSIPVVPKVLEIVGLAYTVWFSSRYLIFKENRDELLTKIEELKKKVLGTSDE